MLKCNLPLKFRVFRFYTLKFLNLDVTSGSYILFASATSSSIFSVKCHISLSHVLSGRSFSG